ncbi:MAG: sulfite exporter TauE/SafE family protein [Planctomycetaceae bacterium]|nr:sulfite exporter TauE/SafE family protein [Planctomycetaceae bacterium]
MELWQACLVVCPAAALGGAINSIAGGGTLVTFPALVWVLESLTGLPGAAIIANATNTVALAPGSFSGSWAYRRELRELWPWARLLAIPSLLGGIAGSLLVVYAPESSFKAAVPWLIALATILFILQPKLTPKKPAGNDQLNSTNYRTLVFVLQLLIGIYGGYFGAGIGILMLSSLSLLNMGNIHQVNGLKTVLAGLINAVSMVVFIAKGKVFWPLAIPMVASAMFGGWLGASWARKLDKQLVRRMVIAIGLVLTTWYFGRLFLAA